MSRQGSCHRCKRFAWLDRCRHCAMWFCNLCFTVKATEHARLRPKDTEELDQLDSMDPEWSKRVFT